MNIKITADSTCDLSPQLIEQHHITVLPLSVGMGGASYLDGIEATPADIYAHVEKCGELPVTAAVNVEQYYQCFSKYAKEYDAVIHVNLGSDFSSCHQNARLAASELDNVYVVDSQNLSTGNGTVALRAAELAESGMEPLQIVHELEELVSHVDTSFILEQVAYLHKGGRCSAVAALGANLLKLKPCIEVKNGKMGVGKKYRGSFEKCLREYIHDRLEGREDLNLSRIFITHSGLDEEYLKIAQDTIRELQPFREICITVAGCTISSHCGPGTLGIVYATK